MKTQKKITMIGAAVAFAISFSCVVDALAADAAFEPGVKYRVRARIRSEATVGGVAFSAGVFDERTWKLAGSTVRRTHDVSSDYAWYDICIFVPNDGEYFWIAPGGLNKDGDKNANAVLLDKISFEPGCVDATLPSVHA
ncbi:MAG: hypothetical protein IJI54_14885 [Kiritimatiellae bacterium]|nr:hypothetical protein [Kiritimatiellia bacterium]